MSTDLTPNSAFDAYRRIVENLATSVLVVEGQDLRLRYVNPAAEALFGISERQLRGLQLNEVVPEAGAFLDVLRRAASSGHALTEREMTLVLPHAVRPVKADCTVTPVVERGGHVELVVELLSIDRILRIAREESLLAQQTAMKMLVRGLAHEVKNPLGGLRGAAQLLERELHSEALKEYTQIIIGEADRLQKLVDYMLGPNKIPNRTMLNIHEVLERVRQLVLVESDGGLLLDRDYDPSIPDLYGDKDQLIQAVLNIVRNAKQALQGKGRIALRTRTQRQFTIGQRRHRLVLRVDISDNGPGIAPGMIEQIFYPMVTGRPDGTGLGLSIAQTIVGQHGGLIECSSVPGDTVFTLLLPIHASDAADRTEGEQYHGF